MNTIKKIQVDGVDYDIQAKELTKVTYAELKEMRDNGNLVAGHLYRITDYEFTTKQVETKSAGHVFDIIVLATSENQLSELARAIQHEGDTYFDGNELGAWELWYDLDNDTTKYEWADATNGKGVIYRMIDEKRNDCPYDFKNALFYNAMLTTNMTTDMLYYTFSYVVNSVLYDGTVEKQVKNCYSNSMGVYLKSNKKFLNLNVFRNNSFSNYCHSNTFGYDCYSNTFGDFCFYNNFGNNCRSNIFRDSCSSNTFKNYCIENTFRNNCKNNTFENGCEYNYFWEFCEYNYFWDKCQHNIFGKSCEYNTFGYNCYSNTFGDNVSNREVNSDKTSITLNEEYYDDGSGQLVPIKHPDLSTEPSILPYKFMGQYVYEQLIPITQETCSSFPKLAVDNPMFLKFDVIGDSFISSHKMEGPVIEGTIVYLEEREMTYGKYMHVVYTSMPEEGDYYGYNNY